MCLLSELIEALQVVCLLSELIEARRLCAC